MVPTKRLVLALFAAALIALAADFVPSLRLTLTLLDALIFSAVLVDGVLGLGRRVDAERHAPAIFSVGRANPVQLTLRNLGGRALRGVVADDPLDDAELVDLPAPFFLPAHGTATIKYETRPTQRGVRHFRGVTVRYTSPLGLVSRQERVLQPARVDVYPDVHAARSLELLRRQGRQDARLGSLRVRGGDTEFERLRPYQRATRRGTSTGALARRDDPDGAPVPGRVQPERRLAPTSVAAWTSRGRRTSTTLNAALLTADVALRGGDRVASSPSTTPPRSSGPRGADGS